MIVLKERLKSLAKLGNIPPDTSASKQITRYHDFESIIQDIIDLGTTDDLNLQMGAFGPPVQEQVLKALTDNPQRKREVAKAGHGKQPRDKMLAFRDKIVEYRRDTQQAEIDSGAITEKERKPLRPPNPSSANAIFPDQIRNNDCRVCKQVETEGNPSGYTLFENHLGVFTYQCPVFMKMKMKERMQVARTVLLCQYCLDSQITTDEAHEATCKTKKTKCLVSQRV